MAEQINMRIPGPMPETNVSRYLDITGKVGESNLTSAIIIPGNKPAEEIAWQTKLKNKRTYIIDHENKTIFINESHLYNKIGKYLIQGKITIYDIEYLQISIYRRKTFMKHIFNGYRVILCFNKKLRLLYFNR